MTTNFHTPISLGAAATSGNINAPLGQLDSAISSGVPVTYTNQSGGSVADNDCVVIDPSNDESITITTTEGYTASPILIVSTGGGAAATITATPIGEVTVVVDSAATRGEWLKTASTAKQVTPTSTLDAGVFGYFTSNSSGGAGTTATAYIFPFHIIAPATHVHAAADITSGLLALARGGLNLDISATGGDSPSHVFKESAANVVSVAALVPGDIPTAIPAINIADGTVTNAEFQYLGDVTSLLQAQLDLKSSTTHKDTHDTGGSDAFAVTDLHDSIARTTVSIDGATVGSRREINIITGTNITATGADDSGGERTNITINSVAGATPAAHKDTHDTGGSDAFAITDLHDSIARTIVAVDGIAIGTRRKINIIGGTNVTASGVDNAGGEAVNVTIDSAAGGGGGGAAPLAGEVMLNGVDRTTVALAAAAASGGDLIWIGEGTYTCNDVDIPQGVYVTGVGKEATILNGTGSSSYAIKIDDGSISNLSISMTVSDASTLTSLLIDDTSGNSPWSSTTALNLDIVAGNTGAGGIRCIQVNAGQPNIINCNLNGASTGGIGIYLATGTDPLIEGGVILGTGSSLDGAGGTEDARLAGVLLSVSSFGSLNSWSGYYAESLGGGQIVSTNFHHHGTDNTFAGDSTGNFTLSGVRNTAVGVDCLDTLSSGDNNIGIGHHAGTLITSGNDNVAIGYFALRSNISANNNVAIGSQALELATATNNTAVGYQSGAAIAGGTGNVAVGRIALSGTTSGDDNVAIGHGTGTNNTTGSNNTLVGGSASVTTGALSNAMALGFEAEVSTSNTVIIGDGNIIGVGMGALTTTSGMLHVVNAEIQPVALFNQVDVSEEMFEFATTIGVGNAIEAIGAKAFTETHFVKVTIPGPLTKYIPLGDIA